MNEKILVVDDEKEIADLIELYLLNEGMEVRKFFSGAAALKCAESQDFDLAILDIMLPDLDGISVCQTLRDAGHTFPVLMLTAKDTETDKIIGLGVGADDYITKPFRPLELMARIKAQLRRYKRYNVPPAEPLLCCGALELDRASHECRLDGHPLSLTPTEFAILQLLLERRGSVVRAEELFRAVWQSDYLPHDSGTITVHIRHLREKLGSSAELIKTVWGVGYKIENH